MLPWLLAEIEEIDTVFGGDAWPYGVEPNRPTLEALVRYMVEQHFIARPIPIEDLFVPIEKRFRHLRPPVGSAPPPDASVAVRLSYANGLRAAQSFRHLPSKG